MSVTPDLGELICLVDDDASVRKALVRLLRSAGFEARAFERSAEFLEYAALQPIRLVILDVWMPEMDGLQVQARLREIAPQTRVIIITARDESATRAAALQAGAVAFITKPLCDEAFLGAVHAALVR